MFGPRNIRCRNFDDEGVGECDSGEHCNFVHPGPRWANARPYIRRSGLDYVPKSYFEGGGGGGGTGGRQGGGGGGFKGLRRCRNYEADGTPIRDGCRRYAKGDCTFTHPDQPGWDKATPPKNYASQANNPSGAITGSNSILTGLARAGSNSSFIRPSRDTTVDTTAGSGFGSSDIHQSPDQSTPSLGWGQTSINDPEQPTAETSSGGWGTGWGGGETNHGWGAGEATITKGGWGADETNNAGNGWGGGDSNGGGWGNSNVGSWGTSGIASGSGGGGWGSSNKDDNTNTTQPTGTTEGDPQAAAPSNNAWGSSDATWGSSGGTWGSSNDTWGSPSNKQSSADNTWGSGWGPSNNAWTSSNETSQLDPANDGGPDKGKESGWGTSGQDNGRSGFRSTSNTETAIGPRSSGDGGWGHSAQSVSATVGIPRDYTHSTPRPGITPETMDVNKVEPHFEGKAIYNALGNAVQRRRNKRKRSHEDIRQLPRYYRHLLEPQHNPQPRVDGDGDAVMGNAMSQSTREESVEAGEIVEVLPRIEYDMAVLAREPKTSEEKTMYSRNLLCMFAEAAVAVARSKTADKKYEDYKRSQEARMYNHPGYDARQVLVGKLQMLRGASHEENEHLNRIIADLGTLPSHHLSELVSYNEHNHLTDEALAQEKRRAAIFETEKKLKEKHDHLDRNLVALQARLDELSREKQTREIRCDAVPPVDPNQMAVEDAATSLRDNVQRVVAVETTLQTITSVEEAPHKDGPIQILEESLPAQDSQLLRVQVFTESLVKLIQQVPTVRQEVESIRAENEQRRAAEKTHEENVKILDQHLVASSEQLEALHHRVAELVEGLKHEITIDNVRAAVEPTLKENTRVILEGVNERVQVGLAHTRELMRVERSQMEAHIYSRLVGTQRLFEAVGCYLRSVRADLASLVDKDIGMTESS